MPAEPSATPVVSFGPFVFDPASGELTANGATNRLPPQIAAVLRLLLNRPGELVTRTEFRQALWPDTTVEFDQGLNFCVRQLRVALSDDAEQPRYIETLPRRGYRFVAAIGSPTALVEPAPHARTRRSAALLLISALVLIVSGALIARSRLAGGKTSTPPVAPVLAILGLDVAPADSVLLPYQASFVEQLVKSLSDRPAEIAVMGPSFTGRFPGTATPPDSIRAAFNATFMLSGAIRTTPAGRRIFMQLIRLGDRRHVYASVQFDSTTSVARMEVIADSIARATRTLILRDGR